MQLEVLNQSGGIRKMKLLKNLNFDKLKDGLSKTRKNIVERITETISGKAVLNEEILEEIEEILITSDIGYDITSNILDNARTVLKNEKDRTKYNIVEAIQIELTKVFNAGQNNKDILDIETFKPYVILIVGVNGSGKTTTIGKLAYNFRRSGLNVVIGSADTFRAAANEQLEIWAKRAGVEIVQKNAGADPSSVAFDTLNIAKSKGSDIVLIDTAGRLHTKQNLMEELKKIRKVIGKVVEHAPNDTYLVIDGNTGQNAIIQAKEFSKYTDVTGLIITKLDGTAKGGAIFQICSELNLPVKYIGIGEEIDDLHSFDPNEFVSALFNKSDISI